MLPPSLVAIVLVLLMIPSTLHSQEYSRRTYTIDDGLASPTVYDITQDIEGRMWFATPKGITCYDGTTWENYSPLDGLPFESYYKIRADQQGNIRAFTWDFHEGITFFNGKSGQWQHIKGPYHKNKNLTDLSISSLAMIEYQQELHIGIGTSSREKTKETGFYIYNNRKQGQQWVHAGNISIFGVAASENRFYIAAEEGLFLVNPAQPYDWQPAKIQTPSIPIHAVSIEKEQQRGQGMRIWLMGKDWVGYCLPPGNHFHLLYQGDIPGFQGDYHYDHLVTSPDGFGGLWLGNRFACIQVVPGIPPTTARILTPLGIASGYSIFYDRESNLWVGSFRGVEKITGFCFENYNRSSGFYDNEVTAIAELGKGNMAYGHNGGFSFIIDNVVYPYEIPGIDKKDLLSARIHDMCRDNQGNVWAAAGMTGIAKIMPTAPPKIKWYKKINSPHTQNYYTSVLLDNRGNLWAAINNQLFQWQNHDFISPSLPLKVPGYIRRLFNGSGDTIYIATAEYGLFRLQKGSLEHILPLERDFSHSIFALHEDKKGNLLVGTTRGLFTVENQTLSKFRRDQFQVDHPVYFITEDHEGHLWFGLNNGVIRWDRTHPARVRHYTRGDGLAGTETNRAAGIVDSSGRIWIGTDSGVSCYYRERDLPKLAPPLLELLFLDASGKKYPLDRPIKLKSHQNDLIFHFRGISFIDEKAVSYKLKLAGFEGEWLTGFHASNNQIRYTNLSPGHYRFYAQAENSLGIKSPVKSSGIITIQKPFHQTWGFYGLLLMGLLLFSLLTANFISKKKYAKQLEEQVRQRTQQLEASKEQIKKSLEEKEALLKEIHHRVKNNLQVISALLDLQMDTREEPPHPQVVKVFQHSKNRIRSMALIYEELYHSRDLARINAAEYVQSLLDYFFNTYGSQVEKISTKIQIQSPQLSLDMDLAVPLGLILTELLSNALEHAFPPGQKGEVHISIHSPAAGSLTLTVKDNGIGLPEDLDLQNLQTLGLDLVHLLTRQVKGTIKIEGREGTTVAVTFPYTPGCQDEI